MVPWRTGVIPEDVIEAKPEVVAHETGHLLGLEDKKDTKDYLEAQVGPPDRPMDVMNIWIYSATKERREGAAPNQEEIDKIVARGFDEAKANEGRAVVVNLWQQKTLEQMRAP